MYLRLGVLCVISGILCVNCCDHNWRQHRSSCYQFNVGYHTWVEALEACRQIGANLVEINDRDENIFLKNYGSHLGDHSFWIGLNDLLIEGDWVWIGSGTNFTRTTFTDWQPGEPDNNNRNENCALLFRPVRYHWDDVPCMSGVFGYICEKPNM